MNDRVRKTLATSVLVLAITSSAFAGEMQTGSTEDLIPSGEIHNPVTEGDMDNDVNGDGEMRTGATESDAGWLPILLSLLNSVPF